MAFPLSPSLNLSLTRSRITCFSKKHRRHVIAKEAVGDTTRATSVSVVERIMERLRSVVPMMIASVQISALVPLVDYVASPGAAEAVLYSPDTKVPRTGEVALRRAIPANANMKTIQLLRDLNPGKIFMGLLVYVDYIILVANDLEACLDFKSYLEKHFHIKDFGVLSFLGKEYVTIIAENNVFLGWTKHIEIDYDCDTLEDISYLLRIPQRKPYGTMEGNVKKALKIAVDEKDSILASIPAELKEKGSLVHASLIEGKGGLQTLLQSIKEQDADKVSVNLASTLDTVAELELLQAPGLSFLLPGQYAQQYPRLSGRGTVEFTIEKGDGSTFSPVGGEQKNTATIQVVIDGYSAPLTAGNFAKLVMDGAYNGAKLNSINQAILSDNGGDKNSGYSVPLEIMPSGQFEPLYKTTLSVQDGELPVLPLSVYGAVAMAHNEASEEYSSPYQFFFYLYDKRSAGLGGISFDEGQFSVFGYTTTGRDILPQIKTGDIIRSAKLIEGQDRLVLPKES
ncbi:unnamed protein product [Sphenostylis stenocarpa]|uniref:PPIase cyclophilin-type domain-containing protein n=1 Tax=Sphenostylis stenocarpa TaxID=92480 RepID=A0AA86W615_9FABA|nr:unnamed protein product [Sphenostylis stenocarpa]